MNKSKHDGNKFTLEGLIHIATINTHLKYIEIEALLGSVSGSAPLLT